MQKKDREFKPGDRVMLVDPEGEIPTEGPATVDGLDGARRTSRAGLYVVTIDAMVRTDANDVDGIRSVSCDQMIPLAEYEAGLKKVIQEFGKIQTKEEKS